MEFKKLKANKKTKFIENRLVVARGGELVEWLKESKG